MTEAAHHQHGRLTHLEFSESVRDALGFQVDAVKSLFACAPIESAFCGLYGSPKMFFGMQPECKALPVAPVRNEPMADHPARMTKVRLTG